MRLIRKDIKRKALVLIGCCCILCGYGKSVNYEITVEADTIVILGKTFKIKFQYASKDSINMIDSFHWNCRDENCIVLMGPVRSNGSQLSLENEKIQTTYLNSYKYLLSFNKEGVFTLPSMMARTISGKTIFSRPFTVRVIKNPYEDSKRTNEVMEHESKGDILFAEASVNNKNIYLGDSVECEIRLYTNMNVTNFRRPSLLINNAYWHSQCLEEFAFEKAVYKDDSIKTVLLEKMHIVPLQTGDILLDSMKFQMHYFVENPDVDQFEAFFQDESPYLVKDTVVTTKPITIHVMEGNPHSPQSRSVPNNPATSLGIVIDRSSSLKAKINSQSPSFFELENLFVKKILKDKAIKDYSITLFAGKPYYPSSTKLKPLLKIAPSEENDGSAIYNAILASALLDGALKPGHPPYSILLLTDGFDNSSSISEKTLTNLLLRNNIRLDVVAFASKNDSIYYSFNDSTGFERIKNLQEFCDVKRIARNTNGEFVLVDSDSQIQNALRKIKSKIANRESPLQQEDDDFNPDETLLNSLYNEIESSTRLKF